MSAAEPGVGDNAEERDPDLPRPGIDIHVGQTAVARYEITSADVGGWRHVFSCDDLGWGIVAGREATVVELALRGDDLWIRLRVPAEGGAIHLQLTPAEFARWFLIGA